MWSFDDDYSDLIGGTNNYSSSGTIPPFADGKCGRVCAILYFFLLSVLHLPSLLALPPPLPLPFSLHCPLHPLNISIQALNTRAASIRRSIGSSLTYAFSDVTYSNDFTIAFWIRLSGQSDGHYAILSQRYGG